MAGLPRAASASCCAPASAEHGERQRAAFPHADVRVLDGAGWPFVDAPAAVADAVGEFLGRPVTGGRVGIVA